MKNNNNKLSTTEQFQQDMMVLLARYYSNSISENVKRALQNKKKLSTQGKIAM